MAMVKTAEEILTAVPDLGPDNVEPPTDAVPVRRGPGRPRKDGSPARSRTAHLVHVDGAGGRDPAPKVRTRAIVTEADPMAGVRSVFDALRDKVWKHSYSVQLEVGRLVGGTPTDRKIAEGWIRTKMGVTNETLISEEVEKIMEARGVDADTAAAEVSRNRNLSGFRRDFTTDLARQVQARAVAEGVWVLADDNVSEEHRVFTEAQAAQRFGELYIEGRQVKAMLKEAAMICVGAGRIEPRGWGTTNKSMKAFLVEHMFVPEDRIYLGVTEPTMVNQAFVHTFRGAGIKLEEVLEGAVLSFTIECDVDFEKASPGFWAQLMLTAEANGLGASRSQGFGRFKTTRFDRIR